VRRSRLKVAEDDFEEILRKIAKKTGEKFGGFGNNS
jgi:hypothetical protein